MASGNQPKMIGNWRAFLYQCFPTGGIPIREKKICTLGELGHGLPDKNYWNIDILQV